MKDVPGIRGFEQDDFEHTARLLRSGDDAIVSATLSNNINIILAALDTAPELYEALAPLKRGAEEADYYCPDDVAEDHTVLIGVSIAELRAAMAALAKASPRSGSEETT